jgi:hypothetical protein
MPRARAAWPPRRLSYFPSATPQRFSDIHLVLNAALLWRRLGSPGVASNSASERAPRLFADTVN